jgi:hypothetical protein
MPCCHSEVARDEYGNALGGIRLAQFAVATALNTRLRVNTPPGNCRNRGLYAPFSEEIIAQRYTTRALYAAEVNRIASANVKAGYITKEGAERTRKEAAQ